MQETTPRPPTDGPGTSGASRSDFGPLYVLEGPDGVGKTELGHQFVEILRDAGADVLYTAFPGHEPGTLGKLVYDVHHDGATFGLTQLSEAGRQLLHLAAHVDAIETRLLPALRSGTTVVLDRYWWSMEAYGAAGGVRRRLIEDMVSLERGAWEDITPAMVILVDRDDPLRPEPMESWRSVRSAYETIAERESARYPVVVLDNGGTIEESIDALLGALSRAGI